MICLEFELCCYIIFPIELQWSLLCFWSIKKDFFLFLYVRVWNTLFSLEEYIRNKVYNWTTCHAMSCRVSPPCQPAPASLPPPQPLIFIASCWMDLQGNCTATRPAGLGRPGPTHPHPHHHPTIHPDPWSTFWLGSWTVSWARSHHHSLVDLCLLMCRLFEAVNVWCPERPEFINRCREKFIICTTLWLYA